MPGNPHDSLLADIETMLDRERAALLSGDLGQLPDLLERKQILVQKAMQAAGTGTLDVTRLQAQLHANHSLLESALRGLRDVAGRLKSIHHAQMSLRTYDGTGSQSSVPSGAARRMEKRA